MRLKQALCLTGFISFSLLNTTVACTGFQLKAQDGTYISGRTVEFATRLNLSGLVIPRHYKFTGTLPNNLKGMSYEAKYAFIGASAFGAPAVVDGFNEKGLTAAIFYFPNYASYTPVTNDNQTKALAPTEFVNWVLSQFDSVAAVKQAISENRVIIAPTAFKSWGGVPPMHYVVYDQSGNSIVIEPLKGKLKVFDNPLGVITNSPSFDWQLTNLSNYINLSPINATPTKMSNYEIKPFGQGTGLLGLPGDFSPPSRFVRASFFSNSVTPAKDAEQAVFLAFHLLNQFDIPPGAVQENKTDGPNFGNIDITIATTVKDPNHGKYYFRTFLDQNIKLIALKQFDLNAKKLTYISMKGTLRATDVSNKVIQAPPA